MATSADGFGRLEGKLHTIFDSKVLKLANIRDLMKRQQLVCLRRLVGREGTLGYSLCRQRRSAY